MAVRASAKYRPITELATTSHKGGVVRVIDDATGDIARTTSGWIEDEKYGWYARQSAAGWSAEYDSDVTRTGRLTLKVSTTSTSGDIEVWTNNDSSSTALRSFFPLKASTSYRLKCFVKTNNSAVGAVKVGVGQFNSSYTAVATNFSSALDGTNDWTELIVSFTSNASAAYGNIKLANTVAGNISDAWFDVNSMTLEEVTTITNPEATDVLLYPKAVGVTTTDNIDQSQVVSDVNVDVGTVVSKYRGQQFTPTKTKLTGIVLRRGASTGAFTGDITVSLQTNSSDAPTGVVLDTHTYTNAEWAALTADTDFTVPLSGTLTVDGSTKYWVVVESTTADASNYANIRAQATGAYSGGVSKFSNNGSSWTLSSRDLYFKTLYSKNTTNLTVRTDTQEVSVTAPTPDGWADGEIIDFQDYDVNPITLAPGSNDIYISSNGASTADGTVDSSLSVDFRPVLYTTTKRATATTRSTASNRVKVRDMGTALRFDGVDDIVNTGKTMTQLGLNLSDFTVSAWYRTPQVTNTDNIIATRNISVSTNIGFNLIVNVGNIQAILCDGSAPRIIATSTGGGYANNIWRQVTATFDRDGLMSIYSNGQIIQAVSISAQQGSIENTSNVGLGNALSGASFFGPNGLIDEPRIWSRALTAQEVSDLYFNDIVPRDGLVAEYLFNEASGTTALDTSGNGNDGTLSGCTYTVDVPLQLRDNI